MNLLYRGSVKDIYKETDHLLFKYSNRYSVFDWGEMPDEIPQKGEALAVMASLFFDYLKEQGIESHYLGTGEKSTIKVKEVAVIRPPWENGVYDYSAYLDKPKNCLVPLEVIFRYHLGQGNSLEKRLQKNPAYLAELGLTTMPDSQVSFNPAVVEYSTKLESTDRYLTQQEIKELAIVSEAEMAQIRRLTQEVARHLQVLFSSFGVKLWDGKFEYAFGDASGQNPRPLFLVDSIGPDELRLTYEGAPLSKELLRQIYAPTAWYKAVGEAKKLAHERGVNTWKEICEQELKQTPPKLNAEQINVASLLYKSLANELAATMKRPLPFEKTAQLQTWRQQCASLL